jgi:protein TonB
MKHVKQNESSAKTTSKETRDKHDVNLRKNSTLYFQIGLILCLLGAYTALEYNFEASNYAIQEVMGLEDDDVFFVTPVTVINRDMSKYEPNKVKPKLLIEPKIIDNDTPDDIETKDLIDEIIKDIPRDAKVVVDISDVEVDDVDEDIPMPVAFVQNVPIYPGCENENNNKDRLKCMSKKLAKLVQRKFDTDIASENGLTGKQRIYIQFKIEKTGEVTLVKTKAPHIALEKEAAKLSAKIPSMKPGIQNHKPVSVLYTLPILFKVEN